MTVALLPWLYAGVLFLFGLMIGSFLNVVIYRAPLGKSLLRPPSACPKCARPIAARDNVPLLGWLVLGGRCRQCRTVISWRYPAVELATGLLWAAVGWRIAGLHLGTETNIGIGLLGLAFVSAMVVTILVDWDHRIILDEISLGGLAIALVASLALPALHHATTAETFRTSYPILAQFTDGWPGWGRSLAAAGLGLAVGAGFSLLIYAGGNLFFKKHIEAARREDPEIDSALGIGDVKLMAFFGAFLGWVAVLFIFAAGSLLCALAGSFLKLRSGKSGGKTSLAGLRERWETGDSVVAFGPFLAVAALLFYFFGDRVVTAWFPGLQ